MHWNHRKASQILKIADNTGILQFFAERDPLNMIKRLYARKGPANTFYDKRAYPGADALDAVRPNFDTLYSPGWMNVIDEPVVIMLQVMRKPSAKSTN